MAKLMSTRQYVNCLINEYNKKQEPTRPSAEQKYATISEQAINESYTDVVNRRNSAESTMAKYRQFSVDTKKALLSECIYRLFDASLRKTRPTPQLESICRNMTNEFINENGCENLLRRFRTASEMLSEMSYIVDKYHAIITEKADKTNEDSFKIDPGTKDKFFEELDCVNADEVVYTIRNRVMDAMNDFVDKNTIDKMEIKEVLKDTKEKIDMLKDNTSEEIQESYAINAKKKISNIRNNRPKTIFENMVTSLVRKAYTNEDYKQIYMEGVQVDMDKVVENCEILYTFLEMVNTSKMINVNEEYVESILAEMKA